MRELYLNSDSKVWDILSIEAENWVAHCAMFTQSMEYPIKIELTLETAFSRSTNKNTQSDLLSLTLTRTRYARKLFFNTGI